MKIYVKQTGGRLFTADTANIITLIVHVSHSKFGFGQAIA